LVGNIGNAGDTFEAINVALVATKDLRITGAKLSGYLSSARIQASQLNSAYTYAAKSGIVLGDDVRVPIMVEHAVTTMTQISDEGIAHATKQQLKVISNTANVLNSSQVIPRSCRA
jgi:hypothetical protein